MADGRNVNFQKLVTVFFLSASFFLGFPCRRRKDSRVREYHPHTHCRVHTLKDHIHKVFIGYSVSMQGNLGILGRSRTSSEKSRLLWGSIIWKMGNGQRNCREKWEQWLNICPPTYKANHNYSSWHSEGSYYPCCHVHMCKSMHVCACTCMCVDEQERIRLHSVHSQGLEGLPWNSGLRSDHRAFCFHELFQNRKPSSTIMGLQKNCSSKILSTTKEKKKTKCQPCLLNRLLLFL